LPITFLIDRDGRIVKRIKGGSDLKELEDSVKSVLTSK
jgi:glutathione peroxidase-family protein